jgi:hypothetical protein
MIDLSESLNSLFFIFFVNSDIFVIILIRHLALETEWHMQNCPLTAMSALKKENILCLKIFLKLGKLFQELFLSLLEINIIMRRMLNLFRLDSESGFLFNRHLKLRLFFYGRPTFIWWGRCTLSKFHLLQHIHLLFHEFLVP